MTMSDEAGLFQAILADPADDSARLVYADWLEDHGDPDRAEFIREQVRLACAGVVGKVYRGGSKRADELLRAHETSWLSGLPTWARKGALFRRGFVFAVSCTARQFIEGGTALKRKTPLEAVFLDRAGGLVEELTAAPHLAGLRRLGLAHNRLVGEDVRVLAGCPHLTSLTLLNLDRNDIGPSGALALAESPHLAGLNRLLLLGCHIGQEGARALASSACLHRLTELDLQNNSVGDGGVRDLVGAPHLVSGLRQLNLRYNRLGPAAARALAECSHLGNLTSLELMNNDLGDDGAAAIAASPHLAGLTHLELRENRIGDAGAQALAASAHLANLVELDLYENRIGDAGALALAASPHLTRVTRISILRPRKPLGQEALQAFKARFG
jgi:uncharacterized protein (TIGR02996 family)